VDSVLCPVPNVPTSAARESCARAGRSVQVMPSLVKGLSPTRAPPAQSRHAGPWSTTRPAAKFRGPETPPSDWQPVPTNTLLSPALPLRLCPFAAASSAFRLARRLQASCRAANKLLTQGACLCALSNHIRPTSSSPALPRLSCAGHLAIGWAASPISQPKPLCLSLPFGNEIRR